jgi:hypothetical protein
MVLFPRAAPVEGLQHAIVVIIVPPSSLVPWSRLPPLVTLAASVDPRLLPATISAWPTTPRPSPTHHVCQFAFRPDRKDSVGEEVDEARHVAGPRCVKEGFKQVITLSWIDRAVPWFGEVLARSARQLPRIGFAEPEYDGYSAERKSNASRST